MKYIAKPFVVEAEEITEGEHKGNYRVTENRGGHAESVIVEKGEFERKFVKATNSPHSAI